jgi:hypothetical protein
LHDPEDRRYVVCDEVLQETFGCARFAALDLTRLVSEHLSPADPIEIEYTIKYRLLSLARHLSAIPNIFAVVPDARVTGRTIESVTTSRWRSTRPSRRRTPCWAIRPHRAR